MYRVRNQIDWGYGKLRGYTGKGIVTAVFDTGVFPHPDFEQRILGMKDYVNGKTEYYDDNGHGTHVSGIIAGNGRCSEGKNTGIAPKSKIFSYKILDEEGNGNMELAIKAIEDCIVHRNDYHIRIINFSMGMGKNVEFESKIRLLNTLEKAWDHGIVVICAAGNDGPKAGSITPPGNLRKIITVGAMDDEMATTNGNLKSGYSGRGPTSSHIMKPEVVAPGTNVLSCNNSMKPPYIMKSGTSMSTPVVSGAVALLLEKYPSMTPAQVKLRLYHTCQDLKKNKNCQGWGCINIRNLLTGHW